MSDIELTTADIPTPLALAAGRLKKTGFEASGDTFLVTSYLFEVALKSVAITLWSGIRSGAPDVAYTIAYRLVRTHGLGEWEDCICQMTNQPLAASLPQCFYPAQNWLNQKRKPPQDDWFFSAMTSAEKVLAALGIQTAEGQRSNRTVSHLLKSLVVIRNKTKAHGAVGPDFFAAENQSYLHAVTAVMRCPLFRITQDNAIKWMHLSTRIPKNTVRGVDLLGIDPTSMREAECERYSPVHPGIYIHPFRAASPFFIGDLLKTDLECRSFSFPNGSYNSTNNTCEFIDYTTGTTEQVDAALFSRPPSPLPDSETHAASCLDVQENVFGNLPPRQSGYIERQVLQKELLDRLDDKNHTIITLHGKGGMGKTSLALWAAHKISSRQTPGFSSILWFSARDVDLKPSGPKPVRADVLDLKSVLKQFGRVTSTTPSEGNLASALSTAEQDGSGRLFIFDNFETFSDARQLHKFLDTYTTLPNKVLMTSRERAFKADYPIEVRGMEEPEARALLLSIGRDLGIEGTLADEKVIESIFNYTDGHPYVMRLVAGEIAREKRYIQPKYLLHQRHDILNAVFERSFNKLSNDGRWVFLLTSNWRVAVPELALTVICAECEIDAQVGLEECTRLSLLNTEPAPDGGQYYWAPGIAQMYGKKKLDSDPDRLAVQDALAGLRQFCAIKPGQIALSSTSELIQRFYDQAVQKTPRSDRAEIDRLGRVLERIAELVPAAWRYVVNFRQHYRFSPESISVALRRWVEEQPFEKSAWLRRAELAREIKDSELLVSSLVSAVDVDSSDVELISEAAFELCNYINSHKVEIPRTRRGVYLAGVRSSMERLVDQLDATALSRLAWLFLLEDNRSKALLYAEKGLLTEPDNKHCRNLVSRLKDKQISRPR